MSTANPTLDLGVAICTHNNERTIQCCLQSVAGLARRVVVVDSGSTDRTVDTAKNLGADVIHEPWRGHVGQKQLAIDHCRELEWTLLLDSDESVEPTLADSIRQAIAANDTSIDGWHVNRKIWFLGGWLHHTFQPEWRLRLFRSGKGAVGGVDPHDRIDVSGRTGRLTGDLRHDPWIDMSDMARRHIRYAEIACTQNIPGGTPWHILTSPPAALFKQLILKRGILDGWRGIVVAGMTSSSTMLKHSFMAAHKIAERKKSNP